MMRALTAALMLFMPAAAMGAGWAVSIFGLSYHPDREAARAERLDNEVNPGLAMRYEWPSTVFAEAGGYRDSGRSVAKFAGVGYQWRFGNLRAGGALAVLHSRSYNKNRAFVTPIPIVSYDFGTVMLNTVYAPKVTDLNEIAAFGFYLTFPIH
jgi:hypothetical protein